MPAGIQNMQRHDKYTRICLVGYSLGPIAT